MSLKAAAGAAPAAPKVPVSTVSGPLVADTSGVSDEQLSAWQLSRAQFEAYNASDFVLGSIPEMAPPEALA